MYVLTAMPMEMMITLAILAGVGLTSPEKIGRTLNWQVHEREMMLRLEKKSETETVSW
jgi:hypothetical protein